MSESSELCFDADINPPKTSSPSPSSSLSSSSNSSKAPNSLAKHAASPSPSDPGNEPHFYTPSPYVQAKDAELRSGINKVRDMERLREANRKLHEVAYVLPQQEMEARKAAEKQKWKGTMKFGNSEVREMLAKNRALRKAMKEGKEVQK